MSAAGMKNSKGNRLTMEYNPKEVASLTATQLHQIQQQVKILQINPKIPPSHHQVQHYQAIILNSKYKDENKLDLHGLTIEKAKTTLSQYLRYKEAELKRGRDRTVRVTIITGWGSHTNGRGVIKEHVMEYLSKNNYRFYPETPNVGCISVKLKLQKLF